MRIEPTERQIEEDRRFWSEIISNPDGTINEDQVYNELYDFSMVIRHCAEIYEEASGGLISKPETLPSEVIAAMNDRESRWTEECIREAREEWEENHKHDIVPEVLAALDRIEEAGKTADDQEKYRPYHPFIRAKLSMYDEITAIKERYTHNQES